MPSANATVVEHVLNGSDEGYGDQFILFTRSKRFADSWARKNHTGVISVDLDLIHNKKIDLSTAEGRIAYIGDSSRAVPNSPINKANKLAKGAKEVLVEGKIPNSKIGKGGGLIEIKCPG